MHRKPKIEFCKCGVMLTIVGTCPAFDCPYRDKKRSYKCPDPECNTGLMGRIVQKADKFFCDKCNNEFIPSNVDK